MPIFDDGGRQLLQANVGHRMYSQRAARQHVGVARLGVGLVDLGQDLLAATVVALAALGERDAAGRALQKPRMQMLLQ